MSEAKLLSIANGAPSDRLDAMQLANECLAWRNMLPVLREYLVEQHKAKRTENYNRLAAMVMAATSQIG